MTLKIITDWFKGTNKLERFWLLAKIEFKLRYYENKLGLVWALAKPLSDLLIFWLAFEVIMHTGIPHFVSFFFIAIVLWNFFVESTSGTINILATKKYLYEYTNMNKIEIYIDAPNHIVIADCVELSRFIEGSLDREKEDFELQVSSPGATESFKVLAQYKKYIGTKVAVKTTEGTKHEGVLVSANENEFVIEETRREKKALGKGNQTVVENIILTYKQIKETKSVLPF